MGAAGAGPDDDSPGRRSSIEGDLHCLSGSVRACRLSDEQARSRWRSGKPAEGQRRSCKLPARAAASKLGGSLPARRTQALCRAPGAATRGSTQHSRHEADGKEMSTTMAFVRMLDKPAQGPGSSGSRVVPIVADEARTFGMANLFKPGGHLFAAVRAAIRARGHRIGAQSYREARDGQILEEGISEAGAHQQSWTAAATSVFGARPGDAAVLHLLLDVRVPARWRSDLGRGGSTLARFPAGCHRGAHDARRAKASSTRTAAVTAASPPPCRTAAPTTRGRPVSLP